MHVELSILDHHTWKILCCESGSTLTRKHHWPQPASFLWIVLGRTVATSLTVTAWSTTSGKLHTLILSTHSSSHLRHDPLHWSAYLNYRVGSLVCRFIADLTTWGRRWKSLWWMGCRFDSRWQCMPMQPSYCRQSFLDLLVPPTLCLHYIALSIKNLHWFSCKICASC